LKSFFLFKGKVARTIAIVTSSVVQSFQKRNREFPKVKLTWRLIINILTDFDCGEIHSILSDRVIESSTIMSSMKGTYTF